MRLGIGRVCCAVFLSFWVENADETAQVLYVAGLELGCAHSPAVVLTPLSETCVRFLLPSAWLTLLSRILCIVAISKSCVTSACAIEIFNVVRVLDVRLASVWFFSERSFRKSKTEINVFLFSPSFQFNRCSLCCFLVARGN